MFIFAIATGLIIVITIILSSNVFAWHENLGITDDRASIIYRQDSNDPQIIKWKADVQKDIDSIQRCFNDDKGLMGIFGGILKQGCDNDVNKVYNECISHPNTLLGCEDNRIYNYVGKSKDSETHDTVYHRYGPIGSAH